MSFTFYEVEFCLPSDQNLSEQEIDTLSEFFTLMDGGKKFGIILRYHDYDYTDSLEDEMNQLISAIALHTAIIKKGDPVVRIGVFAHLPFQDISLDCPAALSEVGAKFLISFYAGSWEESDENRESMESEEFLSKLNRTLSPKIVG